MVGRWLPGFSRRDTLKENVFLNSKMFNNRAGAAAGTAPLKSREHLDLR